MSYPEISIIVPVYNVEKTIKRCLDSILKQTFTNYEVILVDDGSTDSSGVICEVYAKKYKNIRVIHKKNEGLGPTRNSGIIEAQGKYLYHCDSDDWISEDLLEKVHSSIVRDNAQICIFGYDIFTEENGEIKPFSSTIPPEKTLFCRDGIRKFFLEQYYNSFVVLSACNRMYLRSFIIQNNLFFPDLRRSQDIAYSLLLFDNLSRLSTIKDSLYYYVIKPGEFKGRSFQEMIDIYLQIHSMTSSLFLKWNMLDNQEQIRLNNRFCESVANYSSYAFIKKYPLNKYDNMRALLNNDEVCHMFKQYKNTRNSRFMTLFCLAIKHRSIIILNFVSKWHEKGK